MLLVRYRFLQKALTLSAATVTLHKSSCPKCPSLMEMVSACRTRIAELGHTCEVT